MSISLNSKIQRNQDLLTSKADGEIVMLDINADKYFGINSVGSDIWERIEKPMVIADLCQSLRNKYTVSKEQCEQDVLKFIEQLQEKKLVALN